VGPAEFVSGVVEVITRHKATERVTLQSFDWRTLAEVKKVEPRITRSALVEPATVDLPGASLWLDGLNVHADPYRGDVAAAAEAVGAQVLSPDQEMVTPALLTSAHRRGLRVLAWTVNDKAAMVRLIDMGVDGLISDYPDRLREVATAKGVKVPVPVGKH
jgi:glycerophosphoryl diester phosphodiesterase